MSLLSFMPTAPVPFVSLETSTLGPKVGELSALLQRYLRPKFKLEAPSIRVRLRFADVVQGTVERSQLCPPVQTSGETEVKVPFQTRAEAPPPRLNDVVIRVRIGTDGTVKEALVQRGSGDSEVDRTLVQVQQQARYTPARLDGRLVEVWFDGKRTQVATP